MNTPEAQQIAQRLGDAFGFPERKQAMIAEKLRPYRAGQTRAIVERLIDESDRPPSIAKIKDWLDQAGASEVAAGKNVPLCHPPGVDPEADGFAVGSQHYSHAPHSWRREYEQRGQAMVAATRVKLEHGPLRPAMRKAIEQFLRTLVADGKGVCGFCGEIIENPDEFSEFVEWCFSRPPPPMNPKQRLFCNGCAAQGIEKSMQEAQSA